MSATYCADGRRGTKTVGSTTTQYIYDMFGNPVLECHGSTRYAINTFGPNGLISRHIASTPSSFYQFDERGNTVSRSGPTGSILEYHGSETYGLQYASASTTDPFQGFGAQWGYYYDPESGLSLLGQRYYDASYGRFLNQDPIDTDGGVNLFSYARTNPNLLADPSGLQGTIIMRGDDGGVFASGLGYWLEKPDTGGPETISPKWSEAANKLIYAPAGTDFWFWGHGKGNGAIWINEHEFITAHDVQVFAGMRKFLGFGKLGNINLHACDSAYTAYAVNSWLKLGTSFNGYPGGTAEEFPPKINPEWEFTSPINYNPRPASASDKKQHG